MLEQKKQKAILIDLIHPRMRKSDSLERMEELEDLVTTYGGIVVVKKFQKRYKPHPKTFIGKGKVEEIAEDAKEHGVSLVILNDMLKPGQIFNLSEMLQESKVKVWDRIDLILKIFAKHASTTEARLEIELASIRHMGPRIFGMGMELSRQAGGIGAVGIGEKNTEIMKRHLRKKEQQIKKKLEKYKKGRTLQRAGRRRKNFLTVSIVGYTNAGKTTLLNTLTKRKELAANKLFATLDTRVGECYLPDRQGIVLVSDTIGFIRNLPPELIHAFQSTLSEAVESDLLLHVIDAGDEKMEAKIEVVEDILTQLEISDIPKIYVFNKVDKGIKVKQEVLEEKYSEYNPIFISATDKTGIPLLKTQISKSLEVYEKKNES